MNDDLYYIEENKEFRKVFLDSDKGGVPSCWTNVILEGRIDKMFDILKRNDDVRMIWIRNKNDDKFAGRAILWKNLRGANVPIVDHMRLLYNRDVYFLMNRYMIENGYRHINGYRHNDLYYNFKASAKELECVPHFDVLDKAREVNGEVMISNASIFPDGKYATWHIIDGRGNYLEYGNKRRNRYNDYGDSIDYREDDIYSNFLKGKHE